MTYYINVYDVGQAYGGPEEGGWWYATGEFIKTIGTAATLEEAIAIQDAYEACKAWAVNGATKLKRQTAYRMGHGQHDGVDANGDGDDSYLMRGGRWGEGSLKASIEEHPGRDYPTERPRYD